VTADPRVAALVVLRPADGDDLFRRVISAETVHESQADPEAAERVRRAFEEAGFAVGPLVGISFAIEGPKELMQSRFPDFAATEGTGRELSLELLPSNLTEVIHAVVSEAPPDFGPGNY
jgi:hypothetical protein